MSSDPKNIALSDEDIFSILNGQCNIVLYPDIHKYNSLSQLLDPHGACIILFEWMPRYGHWVCITKHGNDVEFFNSYGGYPDDSLKKIEKQFAMSSNQNIPYLSLLLLNSPHNLFYNEYCFQKKASDIKTCGRHCAVRVFFKNMDIYEYKKILSQLAKKMNTDYDGVVTYLTQ